MKQYEHGDAIHFKNEGFDLYFRVWRCNPSGNYSLCAPQEFERAKNEDTEPQCSIFKPNEIERYAG